MRTRRPTCLAQFPWSGSPIHAARLSQLERKAAVPPWPSRLGFHRWTRAGEKQPLRPTIGWADASSCPALRIETKPAPCLRKFGRTFPTWRLRPGQGSKTPWRMKWPRYRETPAGGSQGIEEGLIFAPRRPRITARRRRSGISLAGLLVRCRLNFASFSPRRHPTRMW